jgi:hypothetical protein
MLYVVCMMCNMLAFMGAYASPNADKICFSCLLPCCSVLVLLRVLTRPPCCELSMQACAVCHPEAT